MALPDSIKRVDGTSFIFAYDTEWPASPTTGWSATVDAEIDMGGLADAGARQSVKADLTANRDTEYLVELSVECDVDPDAGSTIDIYAGFSDSATAGTGNPAMLSGTDSDYSGGAAGTLAEGLKQLTWIGSLVLQVKNDADAEPQVGVVGYVKPTGRYMMIVARNQSGQALGAAGGADECAGRVTGMTLQTQD